MKEGSQVRMTDDGPDNRFPLAPWIAFVQGCPGPVKARELRIGPKH